MQLRCLAWFQERVEMECEHRDQRWKLRTPAFNKYIPYLISSKPNSRVTEILDQCNSLNLTMHYMLRQMQLKTLRVVVHFAILKLARRV